MHYLHSLDMKIKEITPSGVSLFSHHFITVIKLYIMKKGNILVFKDRQEIIIKANNNKIKGEIVTDKNTYSTDFIKRWLDFGFVKIK